MKEPFSGRFVEVTGKEVAFLPVLYEDAKLLLTSLRAMLLGS